MTTPPYTTTDLRPGANPIAAVGISMRDLMAGPVDRDDLAVSVIDQRLQRIEIGHGELHEALGHLTQRLAAVLGSDPHAEGDDLPEMAPDGGSPLAAKLARAASDAQHLAARVRAIAAAVDL